MTETKRDLAIRWYEEVWNKGRREAIAEMLAPGAVIHDGETATAGAEGFYPFYDRLCQNWDMMGMIQQIECSSPAPTYIAAP